MARASSGARPSADQHMRRLDRARGASRSGGTCDSLEVQRDHHGLALDEREKSNWWCWGLAAHAAPLTHEGVTRSSRPLLQAVSQAADALAFLTHPDARKLRRFAHAGDCGNILGSRAAIPLRMPAVEQGIEFGSFADVQRADSFGPAKLVRGNQRADARPAFPRRWEFSRRPARRRYETRFPFRRQSCRFLRWAQSFLFRYSRA